jgi:hypothetical protein
MIDVQVIDNFLSPTYFEKLQQRVIYHPNYPPLPWYYLDSITHESEEDLSSFGFEHVVINSDMDIASNDIFMFLSGFYSLLLDVTGATKLLRSRFDMTLYSKNKKRHAPHVDLFFPHISSILYLTDSDGETVLYNKKTLDYDELSSLTDKNFDSLPIKKSVKPKQNRLLIFDGSYIHTGHSPSKYKNRVILNTNLI